MRKLIAWLNARFPVQLVVTREEYKSLREELAQYNVIIQNMNALNNRLVDIERQVKQLNNANGFISNVKGQFNLER